MISVFTKLSDTCLRRVCHGADIIEAHRRRPLSDRRWETSTIIVSGLAFDARIRDLFWCCSSSSQRPLLLHSTQTSGADTRRTVSGRAWHHMVFGAWRTLFPVIALPHLFSSSTVATCRDTKLVSRHESLSLLFSTFYLYVFPTCILLFLS